MPPGRSAAYLLCFGALMFGGVYGIIWASVVYLPAHPELFPRLVPPPTVHP